MYLLYLDGNVKMLEQLFGRETSRMIVRQPLELPDNADKFDIRLRLPAAASPAKPAPSAWASRAPWLSTTKTS